MPSTLDVTMSIKDHYLGITLIFHAVVRHVNLFSNSVCHLPLQRTKHLFFGGVARSLSVGPFPFEEIGGHPA